MFKHLYNTDIIVYRYQKIISIFSQNTKKVCFGWIMTKKQKNIKKSIAILKEL